MNFLPLDIDPKALKAMTDHAEAAFPNECCGFFYGSEDGKVRMVTESTEVVNSKEGDQRRRFAISDKDYLHAERRAAREGLTLLGVYHSHPLHPAIPSEHDLAVALPYFSYVIVSVQPEGTAHLRSWQLNEGRKFAEESIVALPEAWRAS